MARTAPAPNVPPIPGMCPGVAVKAGGAGSGGGSGKGSKKGKGKKKGKTKKGKKNASGNKKKGGKGCGDPVCPVSGRVFVEIFDFGFPGPAPLRWERAYSSRSSNVAGDLGHGWRHNFDWRLELRRRSAHVFDEHGREQIFDRPPDNGEAVTNFGWALSRSSEGFTLRTDEADAKYYVFGKDIGGGIHPLVAVEDANHNRIAIERDEHGVIRGLTDSAGRPYRVESDRGGRLTAISVALNEHHNDWMEVIRYTYDDAGDLASATDAEGYTSRYRYVNHLLVQHEWASGLSYLYRYDGTTHEAYCVETWGEYVGRIDPALEHPIPPAPPGLDTRPVKGINYVRLTYLKDDFYTEVEDGLGGVTRFFGDENGRVVKTVLPNGGVIEEFYDDATGELIQETDEAGAMRQCQPDADEGGPGEWTDSSGKGCVVFYDQEGNEVTYNEHRDAFTLRRYDKIGNELWVEHADGTVEEFAVDSRGLFTRVVSRMGTAMVFHHDEMGNCVCIEHPNGDVEVSEYDYLGRRIAHTDGSGSRTEWRYDRRNEIIYKRHADGSEMTMEWDANRKLTYLNDAGRIHRFEYGGMGWLIRETHPDGTATEYRYDTEGHITLVRNARGQVFRQTFDHAGRAVAAETFEGLKLAAGFDVADRVLWRERALGRDTYAYDGAGLLAGAECADGSQIALEYGFDGPTKVANGTVDLEQGYDKMGRIVHDKQGTHETQIGWRGGEVSAIVADVGVPIEMAYDRAGRVHAVTAGSLQCFLDQPSGRDWLSQLGEHLVLRRTFGPTGMLVRQAVAKLDRSLDEGLRATTADPNLLFWISYEYDLAQNLRRTYRSDGRCTEYDVDVSDRVTQRREWAGGVLVEQEDLRYDAAGTPIMPAARYDAAMRPIAFRNEDLEYDADGRLIRRLTDAGEWTYEWSSNDDLVRVTTPDRVVEMDYDGRGRRMRKRVFRQEELVSSTSYVWTNDIVAYEVDELTGTTRAYLRRKDAWEPFAHVELANGQTSGCFYITNPIGGIDFAIDERGKVVWDAAQTLYGHCRETVTDVDVTVRFQNQFWDADVELVYTRFRWYDPRLGLFVTPDPDLLDGTLNPRDYGPNPLRFVDPTGLRHPGVTNNPQPAAHGHPTRPGHPGSVAGLTPTYLSGPGHWATNGTARTPGHVPCPASHLHKSSGFPAATQRAVDAAGKKYGCHSCGRKSSGYPDGHFTCDHQPPKSQYKGRNPAPGSVRLYPHCKWCSRRQMNQIRGMSNTARRNNATNVLANSRANMAANPRLRNTP